LKFQYLVTHDEKEDIPALITGVLFLSLGLFAVLYNMVKGVGIGTGRAFLVPVLFSLVAYLFLPDNLFGGGMMTMRMQWIFYILLAIFFTAIIGQPVLKASVGVFCFILFLAFGFIRMYYGQLASDGVEDYVSARKFIRPYATVLPLSFAHSGRLGPGEPIINRNWVFVHAGEYLAAYRPLILLENYEANTGYFPLLWKADKNPFQHMGRGEGFESEMPDADLAGYEQTSGVNVDYVLTWCYDSTRAPANRLMDYVKSNYSLLYTSPTGRTVLYARNK
jgi:hypothetical protein